MQSIISILKKSDQTEDDKRRIEILEKTPTVVGKMEIKDILSRKFNAYDDEDQIDTVTSMIKLSMKDVALFLQKYTIFNLFDLENKKKNAILIAIKQNNIEMLKFLLNMNKENASQIGLQLNVSVLKKCSKKESLEMTKMIHEFFKNNFQSPQTMMCNTDEKLNYFFDHFQEMAYVSELIIEKINDVQFDKLINCLSQCSFVSKIKILQKPINMKSKDISNHMNFLKSKYYFPQNIQINGHEKNNSIKSLVENTKQEEIYFYKSFSMKRYTGVSKDIDHLKQSLDHNHLSEDLNFFQVFLFFNNSIYANHSPFDVKYDILLKNEFKQHEFFKNDPLAMSIDEMERKKQQTIHQLNIFKQSVIYCLINPNNYWDQECFLQCCDVIFNRRKYDWMEINSNINVYDPFTKKIPVIICLVRMIDSLRQKAYEFHQFRGFLRNIVIERSDLLVDVEDVMGVTLHSHLLMRAIFEPKEIQKKFKIEVVVDKKKQEQLESIPHEIMMIILSFVTDRLDNCLMHHNLKPVNKFWYQTVYFYESAIIFDAISKSKEIKKNDFLYDLKGKHTKYQSVGLQCSSLKDSMCSTITGTFKLRRKNRLIFMRRQDALDDKRNAKDVIMDKECGFKRRFTTLMDYYSKNLDHEIVNQFINENLIDPLKIKIMRKVLKNQIGINFLEKIKENNHNNLIGIIEDSIQNKRKSEHKLTKSPTFNKKRKLN